MKKFIIFFEDARIRKVTDKLSVRLNEKLKTVAFQECYNSKEVSELVRKLLIENKENLNFIIVIDNEINFCWVYKAEGDLNDVRKNIMPTIEEAYIQIIGRYLFLEKIEDLRMLYSRILPINLNWFLTKSLSALFLN